MVRVQGEPGEDLYAIFRDAGSLCDGELIKFLEAGEWAGPVLPYRGATIGMTGSVVGPLRVVSAHCQ